MTNDSLKKVKNSLFILLDGLLGNPTYLTDLREIVAMAEERDWVVEYLSACSPEEASRSLHSASIYVQRDRLHYTPGIIEIPVPPEHDDGGLRILVSNSPAATFDSNAIGERTICVQIAEEPLLTEGTTVGVSRLIDIAHLMKLDDGDGLWNLLMTASYQALVDRLNTDYKSLYNRLSETRQVYIFGALRNGIKTLKYCQEKNISVLGFIDNDPAKQGTTLADKRIYSLDEVRDRQAVILVASGRHSVPIEDQLAQAGFEYRLSFTAFLFFTDVPYQADDKFKNYLLDLFINKSRYITLYLLLGDDKSRTVMNDLLNLRLTLDSRYAQCASDSVDCEYFDEDLVHLGSDEVFIDGGAYDGDTARRFIIRSEGIYRHIYLFEPEPSFCDKAIANMKDSQNVTVFAKGIYSFDGDMYFSANGDMGSAISNAGEKKISVVSLDNIIQIPVTFIKLDVEGAEAEAIKGSKRNILQNRPKLAIGAYHRCHDMWSLPQLIYSIEPRYDFFLRHYSQIIDDTTIYAIPK